MKSYRAIFIDWDDTIGDWNTSSRRAHLALYERHHFAEFAPDFDEWLRVYRAHNLDLWDAYSLGRITREYLHIDQFLYPICLFMHRSAETAPDEMRRMCRDLGDEYIELTTRFFCLKPDAKEVVEYLAARYPLTIVSNGYVETQYQKLDLSGLRPYFAHTIYSEEVGVAKPNARIMEIAIERNRMQIPDLQASEVLMIGDGYSSDIAGAKAAGIDSLWWIQPGMVTTEEQRRDATYIVSDLREVMRML